MEINLEKIEAAIVAEAVDQLIDRERLISKVSEAVNARIDKVFADEADEQIKAIVANSIQLGLDHSYRRVDSFGRATGEPTTIRAELEKLIGNYWTQKVDRQSGNPSDSSYSAISRAEYVMLKVVGDDFQKDMKQQIVNLGGALKDKLRAELYGGLDRLLSEVIHVKSHGDTNSKSPGRAIIDPPAQPPS